MNKPDWLISLTEDDPDCKEGFYIGLPPNSDELCDDKEVGVRWCWEVLEPGLLELIAYGPPPDLTKVSIFEALTSFPCFRIYVARHKGSKFRAAIVMDKLVADVFTNIGYIVKFQFAKKYVDAWLRSYHPLLALALTGESNKAAQGISLVWTRPSWARRHHWILTSLLDLSDGAITKDQAVAIIKDSRFQKLRNAQRNLLLEDAEYMSLKGQVQGTSRMTIEALEALAKKMTNDLVQDAINEMINDYFSQETGQRVLPISTSFKKPDLFRRFEEKP